MYLPSHSVVDEQAHSWKMASISPRSSPATMLAMKSSLSQKSAISRSTKLTNLVPSFRLSTTRISRYPISLSDLMMLLPIKPAPPVTIIMGLTFNYLENHALCMIYKVGNIITLHYVGHIGKLSDKSDSCVSALKA